MANKQYLIELAIKDDKLKSSLKKSLESPDVQKTLGILGEGITEHLEKDINKATSILGKVDWASLLGAKDFERLQQLVAKTVSANKDLIKSFVKSNDTQGIQNAIELVSELGAELRSINPELTAKGLARSMASFIKVMEPLSGKLNELSGGAQSFQNILNNFDTSTINKNIKETSELVANTLNAMNTKSAKNALKTMFEDAYGSAEKLEDVLLSSDAMDAYLSKFESAKSIADEMNRLMKESEKGVRDIKGRLIYKQQLEGLQGKLKPMLPTLDGSAIKKEADVISKDLDATIEKITDKLEKSFNKTVEEKLGSIRVKVDVPTEEKLIADLNAVINKVNEKGTNSLKLVGAESAIKEAQNKILSNTQEWHNRMKDALKFSKKEDIELDLGVRMREIGSDVGGDLRRSIEEYFDNPANKVSVPVELILTGENKATIEGGGGNIIVNGGVAGGGEITAESLAKALTTPIEVKVQEQEKHSNKSTGKLISLDYESGFAQEVLSVFDDLFKAIERGGENAKKISDFFSLKGINLSVLKDKPMDILEAFEGLLESGDQSLLDEVENKLAKGSTKNKATLAFANVLRDAVFRFDLDNITTKEDIKRRQVRSLVEEDYIPRSQAQEAIYKIRNTDAKDYKLPTVEELDKLMADLPQAWGQLGNDFLPALETLRQLRSTITDPTNASEIKRFQDAVQEFVLNTNPLYREMSDFMHGYKIGVFNKGHNKHNKYFDYAVNGGVFSGNKLLSNLDKVDYFELYDDPSGHFSRGNRKDAMDNARSLDRYQLRRDSRAASYRSKEPIRTSALAENVEVPKFEPKERPDEQLKEINEVKASAEARAKAMEGAKKASAEEEKKAEELRQQELETDKKRRTALKSQRTKNANKLKDAEAAGLINEAAELRIKNEQLDKEIAELDANIAKNSVEPTKSTTVLQQLKELPKANEVQSMIDDVNSIDGKIDDANKKAAELDKFVDENFKPEKYDIGYTKSEQNNQNKNSIQQGRLATLGQLLNEEDRTKVSSLIGLTKKDKDVVTKLLSDRKLYQLINGENGLGLPMNSRLEDIAKNRIQTYQNGLNRVDEFLLKHQGQTLKYVEDDSDLTEFMKDNNTRNVLAGTFKGTKEDETAIRTKINEFKTRMVESGKSYVADYIDMWSEKNLHELMKRDDIKTRTTTDAKGAVILDEFYRRIVEGGISKRGEAYQYLKNESAKYQKSIQKSETSLEKIVISGWDQTDTSDTKNQAATERVKEKYKEYVNQWLHTIQDNMYSVLFGELDDNDAALRLKKNDELRGLIGSLASKYFENFGEALLTEDQSRLLKDTKLGYIEFRDRDKNSLIAERDAKRADVDTTIQEKAELLRQRRFDLLNKISDGTKKGKDTTSLEKSLLEVEDELVQYSDQLPHLVKEEFGADLLNAKKATEDEWRAFRENAIKRRNEFDVAKYTELRGKQQTILKEIAQKTTAGESTVDLEKQLRAINKEIVQYEVNTSRLKDVEFAKFPSDASVTTIQVYNSEMQKLVELQQQVALAEAKGESTLTLDKEIARQKRILRGRVNPLIEEDKRAASEYDPANQAAQYLEATDKTLYLLEEQVKDANKNLYRSRSNLETIQGDKYYTSQIYKDRIESLKDREVADYVRSDEYKSDRQNGIDQANKEFGAYLAETLGEDVARKVVYEFAQNEDRANIDEILNGSGNTTRLVEDAFGAAYVKEHMAYTNSTEYKKTLEDKIKEREKKIDAELKAEKEKTDAKVQEIWNETKEDINKLRNADMANSEELRNAVYAEAEKVGMGDSSEYRRAIVDQVREQLIQERIEAGRQEQKFYNNQYYEKARKRRSELSPAMYQELDEQVEQIVYNNVMAKIQELVGDNADLLKGLDDKRNEIIKSHIGNIVQQYRDSLAMEETGLYKGVNIREIIERELAHEVAFYEQEYIKASGKLGFQINERERAKSFGQLGYDEALNPEIAQVRAETEARLSAEKEKQVALTERLTALTEQNADYELVQSVAAELRETEKTIERLQLRAESASEALLLRKNAREEEFEENKWTPEKQRLWYIDAIEREKKKLEGGTDEQKSKAESNIAKWEQKLANIEKIIEASKPEVERPRTVLEMITHAIRDGLAGVTAGGTVDLDASLYNIATETTLQEILRLLGGNGAVEYANQLKAELAKDRPRYERRNSGGGNTSGGSTGRNKNRANQALDKLNDEGQRIYGELDAQAKIFTDSLKKGSKQYSPDFDFVKAIKEQAAVVKKQTKGSLEYVEEQTKLTVLYQDYYNKTFGKGRRKKGQPGQSAWAGQGELGKISGLKDLLLFKSKRADALIGLNYGTAGVAKSDESITENQTNKSNKNNKKNTKQNKTPTTAQENTTPEKAEKTQKVDDAIAQLLKNPAVLAKAEADGIKLNEATAKAMAEAVKIAIETAKEDGFGRDVNDDIIRTKGETAQVFYDAIIEGFKLIASGNAMYSETSYSIDKEGNVSDVKRGDMWGTSPAKANTIFGHTHLDDVLFGSMDFTSAAQNSGLFDVLELITPFNTYRIDGLSNINPIELQAKFSKLATIAQTWSKLQLPNDVYNERIANAITGVGLKLTATPTNIATSPNFATNDRIGLLQAISNHDLSLSAFEDTLYKFVDGIKNVAYQFDEGSSLDRLITAIENIRHTKYDSISAKESVLDGLKPLLNEVFGVNPNQQISGRYGSLLYNLSGDNDLLADELDQREEEFDTYGKTLFTRGRSLYSFAPDKGGFYRDKSVKTDVAEGVKQGMSEATDKTKSSDNKLPYDVSDDSLIGKLRNTVGGNTGELAKQGTLALVLAELQEISKKIPTIGKAGVKSSAQNLLEEFQKMAEGSALDRKERVAYFDLVNGVMSPALSGTTHNTSQKLIDALSQQYGIDKGYRSQVHTHADSNQTWFSKQDLNYIKKNISDDFGADNIKQQILLTKDTITVFDMTMVETAENAKKAIDILMGAGSNVDNVALEKLTGLGARYESKSLNIGAKGLMDLLGVKNYKNDGKKQGAVANPEVALAGLEAYAQSDADKRNSKYIFNSFDGETLKYQLVDIEGHISKVILTWDELEKKIRVVSDTSTSSMDATVKKIQQYRAEIEKANSERLLSDGDDTGFIAAEQEVDKIIKQIEAGDFSGEKLREATKQLDIARAKLAEEGAKLHKLITKNEKLRGGTAEVKSAVTQGVNIRSLLGDSIDTVDKDGMQLFDVPDDEPKYLQKYVTEYNRLVETQQKYIKDGSINNPKIQDALKVQAAGVKKLGSEAMTAYQNTQRLQEQSTTWGSQTYTDKFGVSHSLGGSKYVGNQGVDREAMLQYAKEVLGADLASVKLDTTTGKLTGVLRKNNYVVANMAVEYDEATGSLHLYQEQERESLGGLPGFINAIKEKSKAIFQYIASMTSIYRVFGEIRKGIQYVREIDSALTELKKVTDETEETYERFLDTASKVASKVGSTIQEVVSSTADWARIGYSLEDATSLAESTAVLLNVSEFQSIDEATSALTSTLQAFSYTAEQSMDIVDVLNEVGKLVARR